MVYDFEKLKARFKTNYNEEWQEDWFNHLAPIIGIGALEREHQQLEQKRNIHKKTKFNIYKTMCIKGVLDRPDMREIYFEHLLSESQLTTRYGVGNCEPMADFALLNAIEKSNVLDCEINYIRFPECEYEELNAIALGNWPGKGCLIVCPWLGDKGEIITWQGNLNDTKALAHYQAVKSIFCIQPGKEMDQFRELLATNKFSALAQEITNEKLNSKTQAALYQQAFIKHIKTEQTNHACNKHPKNSLR